MNKLIAIILLIIYIFVIHRIYSDSKNEEFRNNSTNTLSKCNSKYYALNNSYNKVLDSLYKEREIHSKELFNILENKYLRDTSFIKNQDKLISILENNLKGLIRVSNKKKVLINKYKNRINTKGRNIKYIKDYNYSKSYFNVILKTILLITCIILLVLILYNSFA